MCFKSQMKDLSLLLCRKLIFVDGSIMLWSGISLETETAMGDERRNAAKYILEKHVVA